MGAEQGTRAAMAMGLAFAGYELGKKAGDLSTLVKPVEVEFAPGIDGEVTPSSAKGTEISTVIGELHLPNSPGGVRINVTKLDLDFSNDKSLAKYTSLITQPKTALGDPIKEGFHTRETYGGIGGALLLPVLGAVAIKRLQQRRALKHSISALQQNQEVQSIADARRAIDVIDKTLTPRNRLRKKLTAGVAAIAVMGGCGGGAVAAYNNAVEDGFGSKTTPVEPYIADRFDFTRGMTISGQNARLLAQGIKKVYDSYDEGQAYWNTVDSNLSAELSKFINSGEWQQMTGEGKTVGLFLSGPQCNYGYMNGPMETLFQVVKPKFAIVSGDYYINSGSLPLEKGCYADMADKFTMPLITVRGNHDANQTIPTDLGPQNHFSKTLKGLGFTFVGAPDPRSHKPGENTNLSGEDLNQAYTKQGSLVTKKACEIVKKTGLRPIVVVHYQSAGYETLLSGCASVVNSGHGDEKIQEPTLRSYRGEGKEAVYQATAVTASGYDGGVDLINPAKVPGGAIIQVFDTTSHELSASASITFSPDDGSVKIMTENLPQPRSPSFEMQGFINNYLLTNH